MVTGFEHMARFHDSHFAVILFLEQDLHTKRIRRLPARDGDKQGRGEADPQGDYFATGQTTKNDGPPHGDLVGNNRFLHSPFSIELFEDVCIGCLTVEGGVPGNIPLGSQ